MQFDVGQRVITPVGEALVTQHTSGTVFTTRGRFDESAVLAWVDPRALKDPEMLEQWLDGDLDPSTAPDADVQLVDGICRCDCGERCHRILHKSKEGAVLFRSDHMKISTDCRCVEKECWCLN